ncbi:uncharacterized protein LOC106866084 [Brachypodium distachyon]|uniref:uncharacterized protein LOC106866084 n=1 Tax=Brachypodium distachyon TaxID=15368 RepID=UPI00071E4EAC|nr:uncharacterized protein LOC106866084 [Brachypodium distachyon]|eukprot:XP_014754122.1 uncharacterized protein LOC106866084 [Brachypodium distachyon]
MVQNYNVASSSKAEAKVDSWTKPLGDWMKINVDASFFEDGLRGSVGAIIRNSRGEFVAAANGPLDLVADVTSAESAAVLLGLELAITACCSRVVLHCDNANVVEILKAGEKHYGPATAIFEDCFSLFKDFTGIVIDHCGRSSNKVAHELARQAGFSPAGTWIDSPPPCIIPLLLDDVTLVSIK